MVREKKIFFVGCNKTGTSTIARTLRNAGFSVIQDPRWAKHSLDCDEEYFKQADVFCDMGIDGCPNLSWLDRIYDGVFVLNTRNIKDWLVSVWNHDYRIKNIVPQTKITPWNLTKDRLIWRIKARNKQHKQILEYFKNKNNFSVLSVTDSSNSKVLKNLREISKVSIPKLCVGNVHNTHPQYIEDPTPVREALSDLEIKAQDYNNLILKNKRIQKNE